MRGPRPTHTPTQAQGQGSEAERLSKATQAEGSAKQAEKGKGGPGLPFGEAGVAGGVP